MNIIKPEKLKKGDTIAIIAPCGKVCKEKILKGKKYFETLGYKVLLAENIFNSYLDMAGTNNERVSDLEWAFGSPGINAIICARGGYGAIRIINKINYEIIKNNPKIFCGYSDITALSAAIYKNTGIITFSGPMIQSDFQPDEICEYTKENFFQILSNNSAIIKPARQVIYNTGDAKGILWGGNLATVASLCGTDIIPNQEFIFFAEDLNEPAYKIDRYITQLLNTKNFKNYIKGMVLGDFLNCDNYEYLEEFFKEMSQELNIPAYGGYKISHSKEKLTIPFGAKAHINSEYLDIQY